MSGIFSSLNTSTKGLMASQTALHTTGHNISNINTPGYTRQRVDMKADKAFNFAGVGQLGTGVKMAGIVRMIDNHVSKQLRTENSTLNRFAEKSDALEQLEVIFNEPSDTGLGFNISEMFEAFNNLSGNPGDLNFKTVTVEKLKTLTDTLNHMARQIEGLEGETHEAIEKNVLDFNSKVEQINTLNKQIFNISIKGQIPNDLLDQRDVLLKDLSSIGDVKVKLDDYGRAEITMESKAKDGDFVKQDILTAKGKQQYIGYDKENSSIKMATKNADDAITLEVSNGKLLGNMDALKDIDIASKNLDDLASIMAQAINHVHVNGNTDGKEDNEPIFTFKDYKEESTDGTHTSDEINSITENVTAKNIRININIVEDPSKLQAGKVSNRDDEEEDAYSSEDGDLALKISELAKKKIAVGDDKKIKVDGNKEIVEDSKGNTVAGYYRDMVIKIGVSKQHSDNMIDNQIALTNQLEMRRESVSGVSLNDEITNVIKFQKAYEANAKVISVLTDMLDVLINRTGV